MAHPVTAHLLRRNLAYFSLRLAGGSNHTMGVLRRRAAIPCIQVAVNHKLGSFGIGSRTLTTRHVNEAIHIYAGDEEGDGPWLKDLKKRGLYHELRYGHYHQYKINTLSISQEKKKVTMEWNDGHTSVFDAIWLRHQCHCCSCKHAMNGMVKIKWQSLPMDITVLSAQTEGDKMVSFQWAAPDGTVLHEGAIPTAILRSHCYSESAIRDRRQRRAIKFYEDKIIPEVECEEYLASDAGVHKCLTHVNERGICLIKNVPTTMDGFKKVLGEIGPIQWTMYGESFEVVATPNPINAAYSSEELGLHMDLTFYETAPGLQVLHCWSFDQDIVGGGSIFLDVHELAHKFRKEYPEFFDRLCKLPVVYQSIHYNRPMPTHMENQKTIFSLNHLGELVSVTWHPKLQGPIELPQEDMILFYEAYTAFYKMISESQSLYKFRFHDGDFLILNNRRVLHGREAFSGGRAGGRHLQGAYIELSDFHSRVQALHNKHSNGRLASRCGSHSLL